MQRDVRRSHWQLLGATPDQSPAYSLFGAQPKRAATVVLYGCAFLSFLLANLPAELVGAVSVYTAAISAMLLAASALDVAGHPCGGMAAWGALVFVASDSILAANKFVVALPMAKYLIMVTYYGGQMLIALSITLTTGKPETDGITSQWRSRGR